MEARSTHLRQDEHTLRPRPAPDGTSKGNFGNEQGTNNRARGWESKSRSLEERERTSQRPRAEGRRIIQPSLGIALALAPRRGGSGIGEAFVRRLRNPKRRRAALLGQRPSGDEYGDDSRTTPQKARRGGAEVFFLCRCFSRDKGGAIPTGQGPSRPDGRFAAGPGRLIYLQPANIGKLLWSPRPVVVSFSSRGAAARRAFSLVPQPQFTRLTLGGPSRRRATKLNFVPASRLR